MHIKRYAAHNNKELLKLGFSAADVLVCIFVHFYKELKLSLENSEIFCLIYIRSKFFFFIPICLVEGDQDDNNPSAIFDK